ncbi:MAG: DNA topoisomerase I [Bacteroidales bacterium 45-6]|nr:MAG: DNA topoisomerase I [Bacteroidales bacterium 45-6]
MQKNLVIVESPAKAKTIEKFLGKDYHVLSSYGHIRDLKKKDFGIDLNNSYKPQYEVPADKKKLVAELKKAAKEAEVVWLASDEDREGEAISWHLYETLGLTDDRAKRIAFHEITKDAILNAINNPRKINFNLVDAQQARRVLDRIVGFELSPVLWKKVKPALSAGRVQSVAVRLIVEREREIREFQTEAAYRVVAIFVKQENGNTYELKAELPQRLKTKEEALALLEKLKTADFTIDSVVTKPTKRSPAAPFTTSTLQQEAARKLGFTVAQTMRVAQGLYESGKITYMRTDSVNLSSLALNTSKAEIIASYGEKYTHPRNYTTKSKGAQEAHEAIRPTYMSEHTVSGSAQEKKLYDLIWKRTIASQMADAELEKTTVTISVSNSDYSFVAAGEVIKFDGFLHVYMEDSDDEQPESDSHLLPPLHKGEVLEMAETSATERFSQRPARYTEASLVKKMEELGIGRPSTYAPTISTIQNREYVEKKTIEGTPREYNVMTLKNGFIRDEKNTEITGADKNKLFPTDTGEVVNDFLTEFFPEIMKYNFTARLEERFDEVAEGKENWTELIDGFYKLFHPVVNEVMNAQTEHKIGERVLGVDPKSGRQISVKIGRFGPMVQIGVQEEEEKPQFASLQKDQSISTITLEEALRLFDLPRTLGEFEEKVMTVAIGRFGPYVRHNSQFVSLPKGCDPYSITSEEAIELILEKRKKDSERLIKEFTEDAELQILNGRYGPYITHQKNNYKIPKGKEPASLTYEEVMEIIKATPESDKKGKRTPAKKAEAKTSKAKSTAKKKPAAGK